MPSKKEYSLNLRKFNISSIKDDAVVVFIGRRRTGKSFALRDLMFHNRDIPFGTIISGTEEASPFYKNFIPKTYIFHEFDENIVNNILTRQKELLKKKDQYHEYKKMDPRIFLILDDCLFDNDWVRTRGIRSLFMNGRHFKVFFLITMQYPLGIPPSLRTNVDYTFIMREPYYSNRKRIYENFAGMFPDFNMFCQVMNSLEQYECFSYQQ